MNILGVNRRLGTVTLVPQSVEDLWDLYNVLESGDLVSGSTTRVVKTPDSARGEKFRVPTHLTIRISKTNLDLVTETLKLSGVVVECPEDLEGVRGHHHSLTVKAGRKIVAQKDEWLRHQWLRLVSRKKRSRPLVVVAIESGESSIAIVRDFGIVSIQEVSRHIPGKTYPGSRGKAVKSFFQEILEIIRQSEKQLNCGIVFVGPGFVKNDFVNFLKQADPAIAGKMLYLGTVTSGTQAGIHEALRSGAVRNAVKKTRAIEESFLVEEVLARIGSGEKVAYGLQEVQTAAELGSIDTLLVSENLPMRLDASGREQLEELIRLVERRRGEVWMISPRHEAGGKLERLGGICALLRYSLHMR